jgi:hypothetical protein
MKKMVNYVVALLALSSLCFGQSHMDTPVIIQQGGVTLGPVNVLNFSTNFSLSIAGNKANALFYNFATTNYVNDAMTNAIAQSTNGFNELIFTNWLNTNTYVKMEIDPAFTNWAATNSIWQNTTNLVTLATNTIWIDTTNLVTLTTNSIWQNTTNLVTLSTNTVYQNTTNLVTLSTNTIWIDTTNLVTLTTNSIWQNTTNLVTLSTNTVYQNTTNLVTLATNTIWIDTTNLVTLTTNSIWQNTTNLVTLSTNTVYQNTTNLVTLATNTVYQNTTNLVTLSTNTVYQNTTNLITLSTNNVYQNTTNLVNLSTNTIWIDTTNLVTLSTNNVYQNTTNLYAGALHTNGDNKMFAPLMITNTASPGYYSMLTVTGLTMHINGSADSVPFLIQSYDGDSIKNLRIQNANPSSGAYLELGISPNGNKMYLGNVMPLNLYWLNTANQSTQKEWTFVAPDVDNSKTGAFISATGNGLITNLALVWSAAFKGDGSALTGINLQQVLTSGNSASNSLYLTNSASTIVIGTNDPQRAKFYVKGDNGPFTNYPMVLLEGSSGRLADFFQVTGNGGAVTNFRITKTGKVKIISSLQSADYDPLLLVYGTNDLSGITQGHWIAVDGVSNSQKGIVWADQGVPKWNVELYNNENGEFLYFRNRTSAGSNEYPSSSFNPNGNVLTMSEGGRVGINKTINLLNDHTYFVGAGVDDMGVGGTYNGVRIEYFRVHIASTGSVDTFSWSNSYDNATWNLGGTNWPCTMTNSLLTNGVVVYFGATNNHLGTGAWFFPANPQLPRGTFTVQPQMYMEVLECTNLVTQKFLDKTFQAACGDSTPFNMMETGTNSALYVGDVMQRNALNVYLSTPGQGVSLIAEYWNGTVWKNVDSITNEFADDTANLSISGRIGWNRHTMGDWSKDNLTIDTYTNLYYWMRIRSTNTVTVVPVLKTISPNGNWRFAVFGSQLDWNPSFYIDGSGKTVAKTLSISQYPSNLVDAATVQYVQDSIRSVQQRSYFLNASTNTTFTNYWNLQTFIEGSQTSLVTNGVTGVERLLKTWMSSNSLGVTTIPAGSWNINIFASVDSVGGGTISRFTPEIFLRTAGGVETILGRVTSSQITSITPIPQLMQMVWAGTNITCNSSDYIGMRLYATNSGAGRNMTVYFMGSGNASYFSTPLFSGTSPEVDPVFTNWVSTNVISQSIVSSIITNAGTTMIFTNQTSTNLSFGIVRSAMNLNDGWLYVNSTNSYQKTFQLTFYNYSDYQASNVYWRGFASTYAIGLMSNALAGTNLIYVSDPSGFTTNDMIIMSQSNDVNRVLSISGSAITLESLLSYGHLTNEIVSRVAEFGGFNLLDKARSNNCYFKLAVTNATATTVGLTMQLQIDK